MRKSSLMFTKMHGLGNCYIYLNAFKQRLQESELPALARYLSDVNFGIGSDGIILVGPSDIADVKMRIFNKDGSEAKNCGNGLRCVAKYAYEHELVDSREMTIETLSGVVCAEIVSSEQHTSHVRINMGKPRLTKKDLPMHGDPHSQTIAEAYSIQGRHLALTAVSMGNPHAVFFVSEEELHLHNTLGPHIEKDPRFPEGVNVEFVSIASPQNLHCRVWERGSGVTQACGTGACAVAVAAILNGHAMQGKALTIHLAGGDLQIEWTSTGDLLMTGPATSVAFGCIP